jgi:hypothetical protein
VGLSKSRKREIRNWGLALLILLLLVLAVGEATFGRGGSKHRAPPDNLHTLDAPTYATWIAGAGSTPRTAPSSDTSSGTGHGGGIHGSGFHDGGFHFGDGAGVSLTNCQGLSPVNYVGAQNRLLEYIDCTTGSGGHDAGGANGSDGSDDLVPSGDDDGVCSGGLFGGGHSGSGGGGSGGGGGGGGPGGNFGTFDPPGTIGGHDPGSPPGGDPPGGNPPPPNGGIGNPTILTVSPVPEPDVWAMLILGFGFVGFALRRRREHEARTAAA